MAAAARRGAELVLALLLFTAGTAKLGQPRHFAAVLQRLLPSRLVGRRWWRPVAPAILVGAGEVLLGIVLAVAPGSWRRPASALAAVVFAGFAAAVAVAVRKGANCGCFGSLSDGPAAGGEMGRALALFVVAITALLTTSTGASSPAPWATALAVVGILLAVLAAAGVGARLLPSASKPSRFAARLPRSAVGVLRLLAGETRVDHPQESLQSRPSHSENSDWVD